MPRRKRHEKIHAYHLNRIDRQACLLRLEIDQATLRLTPFRPHYDALSELNANLRRALNLLNDRPADWVQPRVAWHPDD